MTAPATKVFEVPVYSDPEVTAMCALIVVLADLDDAAKYRVLRWAAKKFQPSSK